MTALAYITAGAFTVLAVIAVILLAAATDHLRRITVALEVIAAAVHAQHLER